MVAGTGWSSSGNSEEEAIVGRIENSTLVAIVRCQRNKQKQGAAASAVEPPHSTAEKSEDS